MIYLLIGLVLFLGVHSIRLLAADWRTKIIDRIGVLPWKALYSVVSLAGFVLIVWGFGQARAQPVYLWIPPHWTKHVTALLMLFSFLLIVAAYVPGNRLKARVGHPMVAAIKTWALAHLITNGTLVDVILFGAFLVWAIVDFVVLRRRDADKGVSYPVSGIGRDILVVLIGVVAYILFIRFGHEWLIGVRPFG